jgi:hypothetical protein
VKWIHIEGGEGRCLYEANSRAPREVAGWKGITLITNLTEHKHGSLEQSNQHKDHNKIQGLLPTSYLTPMQLD